ALEVGGLLGVVRVEVQRVVVHGDETEKVIVVLGHGLARPELVDGTDLELLEVAAELHRGQLLMVANGNWCWSRHLAARSYRSVARRRWPKSRGCSPISAPHSRRALLASLAGA